MSPKSNKSNHKKSKKSNKLVRFFKKLGPGLVTGASDDDPSGIATYSQAGAQFGTSTLWTVLVSFPLMAAIQEMCARIGVVTKKGLTEVIRDHYPKPVLYGMLIFTLPAIVLNIGADIAAMGAVANLIVPSIHASIFSIVFTAVLIVLIIYLPYEKMASFLKYLCVFLLLYLVVPFLSPQDWGAIFHKTITPTLHFDKEFIMILVAIFGTTISPYLFFWQASMEAEDIRHKKRILVVDKRIIRDMELDVDVGMFFSNMVMYFLLLTSGTVLFNAGIHQITTVDQAAKALEPIAGQMSYILFAIGVIGTGFLAIPVLSGSLSYMISETFGWSEGLDKKWYQAKPFYLVIIASLLIGLAIIYVGISPIQALLYTAILYGVTSPVAIGLILLVSNNKKIMGKFKNGKLSNFLGILTLVLMTAGALILLYFQFV